ncbi:glycosyltransferase [Geomicrobium sp. JSM 1781026]|uniref:glycosyltransferase n=1 Tax=Geomicrobium sp. JSM 1781026 TaxID=3344580 RepID=UPI0035BFFF5D
MEKKNIVFLSHTNMGGPFVVGSHHYAKELSMRGHKVFHISTPVTLFHKLKKDSITRYKIRNMNKLMVESDNLFQLIPYSRGLPWKYSRYIYNVFGLNFLTKPIERKISQQVKEIFNNEEVDYLILDQPIMVGLETVIEYNKLIYRPTDIYEKIMEDRIVTVAEKNILSICDGVISTSPTVDKHISQLIDKKFKITLENAGELNHFKKKSPIPKEYEEIAGFIAVYIGALDKRFDFSVVSKLASNYSNLTIVIIGPIVNVKEAEKLKKHKNVKLLGSIDYSEIPSFLQHSDVALLPLSDHPANQGRSPMKLYEYLASGLPVVSKNLNDLRERNLDYVYFYDNVESLHTLISDILKEKIDQDNIASSVGEISWSSNTNKLLDFINKL